MLLRGSNRHSEASSHALTSAASPPLLPSSSTARKLRKKPETLVEWCGCFVNPSEIPLLQAVTAIEQAGLKGNGKPRLSFRAAAATHGVNHETLRQRYNGRASHSQAALHQMRLTPAQEQIVKEQVIECQARGIPLAPADVMKAATLISKQECGERWYRSFRQRNPDLIGKISKCLEAPRAQALNRANVTKFFDMISDLTTKYNIPPHLIYNMDEKGVQLGKGGNRYVLVDRNMRTVSCVENGNRQNVTVIECVCADGTALHPCVIFKARQRDLEIARNNPCNAR
jgi:hypothetical protein